MPHLRLLFAALLPLFILPISLAHANPALVAKAEDAVRVLDEVMRMPESALPQAMLRDAHAIAVIPDVVKAGLVLGGRHGRGMLSVKSPDGTWSNPSFIRISGGSVGWQAGVQATDVILVFRSQRGVDTIVNGKFTMGADASVAAGPVGRSAAASTDGQLRAEIYSYSRSRGLFAGVALDGSVISIDHRSNQRIFGRNVTPRRIFEGGVANVPGAIVDFRDRLEEYTNR
ncbi:MAG: lipid-binding SYLF domain-containing protein [Xanthomonadales bacterium]|nr:lipid-binding SYLF domain-containing protein [Xanthomonadales bacterium]